MVSTLEHTEMVEANVDKRALLDSLEVAEAKAMVILKS